MENTYVGPFLIVKKLGTNRRQKVYHARQTEQDKDVALKFIKLPPSVEWVKALDKIDREVNELQKLRHPNLVKVFGAGVHEERIFFATELIEGESLSAILARRGKLTPDLVVEYGRQIAEVLRYLHSNDLIHSKLTPEKILVTQDHKIKISDLRLNRSKRRRWDAPRRRELDIAAYMAPEQFTEGATPKSDFYSLGVILYEMLTGKLPYQPDTMGRMTKMKMNAPVPSVATDVMNCPIWVDKVITQMLSPDPRKRPHSARAIALGFEEIKKIDASKKAAVSQISGNFNPLTAGQDKTEARRLLGIKKPKKKKQSDVAFYQQIPFQIAALVGIVGLTIFLMIPRSHQEILDEAQVMILSDDSAQWGKARINLKKIMDAEGKYSKKAEEMYYESHRKSLVHHAENGKGNRLQSENVQLFGKAVRFQQDGKDIEASDIYSQLVAELAPDGENDPEGKERHIYLESKSRLKELAEKEALPTDVVELTSMIAKAKEASEPADLVEAQQLLARIAMEFYAVDGYEETVTTAKEELTRIKDRIARQRNTGSVDPQAEQDPAAESAGDGS
ncbi:MAG: serine/threonine protein kinase [Mariniblastus sp.]